jgi:hypothetical protein
MSIRLSRGQTSGVWGTAHRAEPLNRMIVAEDIHVWPLAQGKERGQAIPPLHPGVPEANNRRAFFFQLAKANCNSVSKLKKAVPKQDQ